MIPDGEEIVAKYLSEHAGVAALVGDEVVGTTPDDTSEPWVRLTQLDAQNAPNSRPEHLISYLFQLDCYAGRDGGQAEASILARTVRAALDELPDESVAGAVVTSARFVSMVRLPDQGLEPARERFVLTAAVHMHPGP